MNTDRSTAFSERFINSLEDLSPPLRILFLILPFISIPLLLLLTYSKRTSKSLVLNKMKILNEKFDDLELRASHLLSKSINS